MNYRRTNLTISLIICILILASTVSLSHAFKNEPDGFRGIKWGTNIVTLSGMSETENDTHKFEGMQAYVRKGDELNIGDVKLKSIRYYFWKGQFAGVLVSGPQTSGTQSFENLRRLRELLLDRFGPGEISTVGTLSTPPTLWKGKVTTITASRHPFLNQFSLWFESTPIIKQYDDEQEKLRETKFQEERQKREKRARETKGF